MARRQRKSRSSRKKKPRRAKRRRRVPLRKRLKPIRRAAPIWKRTSGQLTPEQRPIRAKSLEALSLVRYEGLSLRDAAKQVGLSPEQVRQNTNAFVKVRGRWRAKAYDRIPRPMVIYEKSRKTVAEVADSRTASLIGKYHSTIKQFLRTGKSSALKRLPRTRFKDIKGRSHIFETRPKQILAVKAREGKPEEYLIYRW